MNIINDEGLRDIGIYGRGYSDLLNLARKHGWTGFGYIPDEDIEKITAAISPILDLVWQREVLKVLPSILGEKDQEIRDRYVVETDSTQPDHYFIYDRQAQLRAHYSYPSKEEAQAIVEKLNETERKQRGY